MARMYYLYLAIWCSVLIKTSSSSILVVIKHQQQLHNCCSYSVCFNFQKVVNAYNVFHFVVKTPSLLLAKCPNGTIHIIETSLGHYLMISHNSLVN